MTIAGAVSRFARKGSKWLTEALLATRSKKSADRKQSRSASRVRSGISASSLSPGLGTKGLASSKGHTETTTPAFEPRSALLGPVFPGFPDRTAQARSHTNANRGEKRAQSPHAPPMTFERRN
ncbi:hypothetical protein AAFF_G00041590 [Aldrovandia affinis]|uniref:Uncharacterized protein n=1 Tax=Aldrovandia affinis TaxID=143900 RepID=A0AAD7S2M1_9TELE|nr:hypothetical protein AAFF_G00041590 [Aldrovandia affinis]